MEQYFEEIVKLLTEKNLTISTCESITGGLIASMLVEAPGASKVFKGSIVSYSNEAKIKLAKVKETTISKYGAISPQTANEMCLNTNYLFNTDIAVSTTGNAGPHPAENKPVGLVFVSFCVIDKAYHFELNIKNKNRNDIRIEVVSFVFRKLLELIKK